MNDQTQSEQPASRRRVGPVTAVAAGTLAGIVLGFGGIASAQTADTPTPSPSTPAGTQGGKLCDKDKAPAADTADSADSVDSADASSSAA